MPCVADKDQCKGEWFTGPWSQVSVVVDQKCQYSVI